MPSSSLRFPALRLLAMLCFALVFACHIAPVSRVSAQDDDEPAVAQTVKPPCNCGDANCRLYRCPRPVRLFAPLDGGSNVLTPDASTGAYGYFFSYVNRALPWLVAIAVGKAVLQSVVGGMQILFSAGGAGKDAGKDRLLWAIAGFVLLTLTGFILKTINPLFFQ